MILTNMITDLDDYFADIHVQNGSSKKEIPERLLLVSSHVKNSIIS